MANPQAEDGHIDIANEISEALMRTNLSAYQSRILWAIWRKTYGYHKKDDWISNSQLVEMTGIAKGNVSRTVKELKEKNMVINSGNKLSFNKDYTQWRELPKGVRGYSNIVINSDNNTTQDIDNKPDNELSNQKPVINSENAVINSENAVINSENAVINSESHKRKYTKENNTKENTTPPTPPGGISEGEEKNRVSVEKNSGSRRRVPQMSKSLQKNRVSVEKNSGSRRRVPQIYKSLQLQFDRFWAVYPKKRAKGNAETAFLAIAPDEQLLACIVSAVERAKTSAQWQKRAGEFIPYPATWLNARGWEDEFEISLPEAKKQGQSTQAECGQTDKKWASYCRFLADRMPLTEEEILTHQGVDRDMIEVSDCRQLWLNQYAGKIRLSEAVSHGLPDFETWRSNGGKPHA